MEEILSFLVGSLRKDGTAGKKMLADDVGACSHRGPSIKALINQPKAFNLPKIH
jgi:hypothetical protein